MHAILKFFGTNRGIAAATLLLLVALLPFRELIPAGRGLGYDGLKYADWTRRFSLDALSLEFSVAAPQKPRLGPLEFSTYNSRRILPSIVLHYALRVAGVPATGPNVIRAFTALNILLLTLAVYWWCCAAEELGLGIGGKWLGFLALIVNYANLKMPLFYPVLTDTFAFALGAASLLLFLRGQRVGLLLVTAVGAFVWPTIVYFGCLLVAFPRPRASDAIDTGPSPKHLNTVAATGVGLGALVLIAIVVSSDFEIGTSPVKPLTRLFPLSALCSALYLFAAFRSLLDSRDLWRSVHPLKVLRSGSFWTAALLVVIVEAVVIWIATSSSELTANRFLGHTLYSGITQPGSFYLAHVLFYGPLVIFLPFVWRGICEQIQRHGTGLIGCFAIALAMSVGSESRQLIHFYPFIALFMIQAVEGLPRAPRDYALLALLSLAFSKIWLPMSRDVAIPLVGVVAWRTQYVSSRGPWIDHEWYVVQLAIVAVVAVLLYAVFLRRAPLLSGSRSNAGPGSTG